MPCEVSCLVLELERGLRPPRASQAVLCPRASAIGDAEALQRSGKMVIVIVPRSWLPALFSQHSLSLLFLCFLCTRNVFVYCIKLYFIFPVPGISKMYTDIIRGESMIMYCITCIFLGTLRDNLPYKFVFRGRNFFVWIFEKIILSWCISIHPEITTHSRYFYCFLYTLLWDQLK